MNSIKRSFLLSTWHLFQQPQLLLNLLNSSLEALRTRKVSFSFLRPFAQFLPKVFLDQSVSRTSNYSQDESSNSNKMHHRKLHIVSYLNQFHLIQTLFEIQHQFLKFYQQIKYKLLFIVREKFHLSRKIRSKRKPHPGRNICQTLSANEEELYYNAEFDMMKQSPEQLNHILANSQFPLNAVSIPIQMFMMPLVGSGGILTSPNQHLDSSSPRRTRTSSNNSLLSPPYVTLVPASTAFNVDSHYHQASPIKDYLKQAITTNKLTGNQLQQHSFSSYWSPSSTKGIMRDDRGRLSD